MKMKLETRLIREGHKYPFYMFQQHPFLDEWGRHVIFALSDGDEDVALAYAWNLESLEDATSTEYVEILLLEAREQGRGYGSTLLALLKEKYSRIGVSNIVPGVEGFWWKCGFGFDGSVSLIDDDPVMVWEN